MPMPPRPSALLALAALAAAAPPALAGPTPAQKCAAAQRKAAGKAAEGGMKCWVKAQAKGLVVDAACLAKADTKLLDSFSKSELKGGCSSTGQAPAVSSTIAGFLDDVTTALGAPGANACAAAKEKAAGKQAATKLGCHAKAAQKGLAVDTLCLDKAGAKLLAAFAKAEAKGGCVATGDAAAIAAAVDALVAEVLSALSGPPVGFAADVQPILGASCAVGGCHVAPFPAAGLDLAAGNAHAALVGVASSGCPAYLRVAPGAPGSSYLLFKLQGSGPCFVGSQMPLFGPPLPAAQIQIISDWIAQGAADD